MLHYQNDTNAEILINYEYVIISINDVKLMILSNGDILYVLKSGDMKIINTEHIKCKDKLYTRKYIIEFAFTPVTIL